MGQLDRRIGIVTGAASGIGAACARVLAREGARLILTDLDAAAGQQLAGQIGGVFLHHDVTDESVFAVLPALGGFGYSVGRKVAGVDGIFGGPQEVRDWLTGLCGGDVMKAG